MAAFALTNADMEALEVKLNQSPENPRVQRKILACIRARKIRRPELVVRCALPILANGGKVLGSSEVWDVREQFYLACLELHMFDHANYQLNILKTKFPGSIRVRGLSGMMYEAMAGSSGISKEKANELLTSALETYDKILKDEPANAFARKRKVCNMWGLGTPEGRQEAIRSQNEYLDLYTTDIDGWKELAEMYLEAGHVEAAKFAFEEVVMLSPVNHVHHTLLADALYTLGDFCTARKYYAQSLELNGTPTNARASLGMVLCTTAISQKRNATADEKANNPQLFSCGKAALLEAYSDQKASATGQLAGRLVKAWLK